MADTRTLAEAGEFEVIGLVSAVLGTAASASTLVGLGDDAAVTAPGDRLVAALDQMVEGRHFRRDWSGPHDIGRKAAARSLSDVAAMGGASTALLVGLAVPGDTQVQWVLDLAAGIRDEADRAGAAVIGGDTVESPVVVVTVTALGDLGGRDPVLRSGAREGDVVCLAGALGRSAAGLAVLSRGHRSPRALVEAHRVPEPPYAAGVAAARAGATAMIDISDGLLSDLGHIADQSTVTIDVTGSAVAPDPELEAMARNLGLDALEWVLRGGEDHALAATFPAGAAIPEGFRPIGSVRERGSHRVVVDGAALAGATGHEHFRS